MVNVDDVVNRQYQLKIVDGFDDLGVNMHQY
jgi:hypothetical protein